jgi:hypothetical protein
MTSPTPSPIPRAAGEAIAWYVPDDLGKPYKTTGYAHEAIAWQGGGKTVLPLVAPTAPTTATAPVLRCACGNIAEPRDAHVDALRCKSCWARFASPTQGADARPVAWATKLPSGNLSSVRPSLKGAEKRTAAWNERFPNPPHAVTVALCECVTRDATPVMDARPVVIYQMRSDGDFWHDIDKSRFDVLPQTMRRIVYATRDATEQAARATAEQSEQKLDKRAQVSNTRFGVGVKWSTVIGAAQRYHDFMTTPEKESERIEKGKAFLDVLTACGNAEQSRDSVIEQCALIVEQHQETFTTMSGGEDERHLTTRRHGNQMGMAYANAIRALKSQQDAAIESKPAESKDSAGVDARAKAKEFMAAARNAQMFLDIRSVVATCADLKARAPYRHVEAQRLLTLLDAFLGKGFTGRVIEFKRMLDAAADSIDAARYRWLKENCFDWAAPGDGDSFDYIALHFENEMLGRDDSTIDAAIDAEIDRAAIESQRSGDGS